MAEIRIPVFADFYIWERDLSERFIHSGGPGGQNVNKVASGVQLRYNPRLGRTLPWEIILKAEKLAGQRLNSDGGNRDTGNPFQNAGKESGRRPGPSHSTVGRSC